MQYLKELFSYNARFADEIIKSLRTIDPARLINEKVSAWGSLRDQVMHLVEAEAYWINKIIQNKPFNQYDFNDFPDVDAIEKKWKEIDSEILSYLNQLSPSELKHEFKVQWDKEYSYPLERILQHLYTHTVHTRGQIVANIRRLGGEVPYVDII